jgi:dolichol-phosphate mannosyltransferase
MVLSLIAFVVAVWLRIFEGIQLDGTPLPVLGAMFFTVSIQILLIGVLADLVMRTYYESQGKRPYYIDKHINL